MPSLSRAGMSIFILFVPTSRVDVYSSVIRDNVSEYVAYGKLGL